MHFERKIEKHKYLRSEMSASRDRALPAADGKAKLIHDHKLLQKVEDYGKLVRVLVLYYLLYKQLIVDPKSSYISVKIILMSQ